jgi:hypothetical protein
MSTLTKSSVTLFHDRDAQSDCLIPLFHLIEFEILHSVQVNFSHGHPNEY